MNPTSETPSIRGNNNQTKRVRARDASKHSERLNWNKREEEFDTTTAEARSGITQKYETCFEKRISSVSLHDLFFQGVFHPVFL